MQEHSEPWRYEILLLIIQNTFKDFFTKGKRQLLIWSFLEKNLKQANGLTQVCNWGTFSAFSTEMGVGWSGVGESNALGDVASGGR